MGSIFSKLAGIAGYGVNEQLELEQEKDKEACKDCCRRMEDNETHRQNLIERRDKEIIGLQQRHLQELQRRDAHHIHVFNKTVEEHQQYCRDLSLKIERLEHLHSQQSMADSGSYQDSSATPPLLQAAVDSVTSAITACASELFSRIKQNSLTLNYVRMNADSKDTGQITKAAFQSFLCHALFKGFEDPFWCASAGIPLFERPARRKALLFQTYKRCRDLDARQMFNDESEFVYFTGVKKSELCNQLREHVLAMENVQKIEDFFSSELRSRDNNLSVKLLRLLKAVWVLHNLAFSFEPSAEIIQVGQGSALDDEFMKDAAGDDEQDDNEEEIVAERIRRVKKVRFMCVPGFMVRHTIIKAQVFCMGRNECRIGSQMEESSPLTLG